MGLTYPGLKQFYLLGDEHASKRELDVGVPRDMEDLRHGIAAEYTIVQPEGTLSMCATWTSFTDVCAQHRHSI
jgi:hypothetical protein